MDEKLIKKVDAAIAKVADSIVDGKGMTGIQVDAARVLAELVEARKDVRVQKCSE